MITEKLSNEAKTPALNKGAVIRSFKWKRTTYCSLPPYSRIEEESEDESGNNLLSFWDKNKAPQFQSHYKGQLINSSERKEFGRMYGDDMVSHLFNIHKDAVSLLQNCV